MRAILVISISLVFNLVAAAQDILSGSEPGSGPVLFNSDEMVLGSGEPRKDLACSVTPWKAQLGFDMKFHGGYDVSLPLHEIEGNGNQLSILFRVTPKANQADPVYFVQHFVVPPIEENAGGYTRLEGRFDLGEGTFHVDWLMRDLKGRFCSVYWDTDASLASKDRQVSVALPPQAVRPLEAEQFQDEPPLPRVQDRALNVKVLMNFAPPNPASAALDPSDTLALVSILRSISRNPQIGKLSLVAFNAQEQKEFYRQEYSERVDFPALGESLKQVKLGTVDLSRLAQKHPGTEFLSSLVKNEVGGDPHPDALIFVGPKSLLDSNVPQDDLKQVGELDYPVFYMNYNADPQAVPWRDAIGRMVKFFKGREYTISGPRDLWNAMTEMVSRITKSKESKISGLALNPPHFE